MSTYYKVQLMSTDGSANATDGTASYPCIIHCVEFVNGLSTEPVPRLIRERIAGDKSIALVAVEAQ